MIFERIKSEGLAHNSYFVSSGSSAVVIDPRRDIDVYLDLARKHAVRVRAILETHRHEDYVTGSVELGEATQAPIYHGPRPDWRFGSVLKDGQEFKFGQIQLTALYTPGHTDESVSFILIDLSSGKYPVMVFSGDALFVGDTGRVDLYGPAEIPRLSATLYESIFKRILPLGDGALLCPAHGAGSVCGLNIADRDESSLGIERLQNPSLSHEAKDDFVKAKVAERPERPPYFTRMEKYNLEGPPLLRRLPIAPAMNAADFKTEMDKGAIVVDTRLPAGFGGAHLKGAHSIWLDGLPSFAGWLLPYDKPILLVLEDSGAVDMAVRYLVRVGYDHVAGYLKDGIEGWYNAGMPVEHLPTLSVQELKAKLDKQEELTVLDVRDNEEWDSGHIEGARHIYVGHVASKLADIPKDRPVATLCSVGHRAGIAAAILLKAGYPRVYNVLGSMTAWRHAGYPVTQGVLEKVG